MRRHGRPEKWTWNSGTAWPLVSGEVHGLVHAMWHDAITNGQVISTDATGALIQPTKARDGLLRIQAIYARGSRLSSRAAQGPGRGRR